MSLLFNVGEVQKRDVWDIDLVRILDILIGILETRGDDFKVAGRAVESSSLIYRMKVEQIHAMQRAAFESRPSHRKSDIDIPMLDIPYRHESTRPVSLEDILGMLQNLVVTMANPKTSRRRPRLVPEESRDPASFLNTTEDIAARFGPLILAKAGTGSCLLWDVIRNLDELDSVRCFLAALFLAKDGRVELEQEGDGIRIRGVP